ncbi:protein kinase [Gemmatimonadota bacterium]
MVGERILHYEIIELLGRGAMGSVYKALDTRLDTFRTLKFLNLGLRDIESARDHLVREAKTQAQLIHPNIATLLALEIVGDQAFLVIEYIDGSPLDQFLVEEDPDLKDRFRLLLPIANAIGEAHQRGIIHRDIKPSNILVGRDGSVKVTDFGLAKAIGHTELSKTGETKGSVLYMPPEAFRGERVRKTHDVWSLGVVSYEVLNGHPPFEGDSFEAIGYRILREKPPALSELVLDSVPGIEEFLEGCLEKDPADRIQTGLDAFQQLRQVAEGAGVEYAAPVVRPVWGRKQVRSRKQQFTRVGVFILIALAATLVLFSELSRGFPEYVLNIPILQGEDHPAWNQAGTQIAYLVGDPDDRRLAIRDIHPDATAEFHDLPEGFSVSTINWSLGDSIMVVCGSQGAILYNLNSEIWQQINDYWVNGATWSRDSSFLVWACQSRDIEGLEVVRNVSWENGGGSLEPDITTVRVDGLPPPVQDLGLYDPIITHDDTRIYFVMYRLATCLGIWSVPVDGGEATCAISGESFNVWDLQWDPLQEEIICRQYEEEKGILRLEIASRTGRVRKVTPVRFAPGDADEITDFSFHPGTGQWVLRVLDMNDYLWTAPLSGENAAFRPFITDFRQILTPSVSPDQTELLFSAVDVDRGVLIQVHDLETGNRRPLHAPSNDFGSETHPQVDPVDERNVIFTGSPETNSGELCYWDRNERRLRYFDDLSVGGRVVNPRWSIDGRYIYYRYIPGDEEAHRLLLRIQMERTGALKTVGVPDTLFSGRDLYYPTPGPDDEFAVCQRGLKKDAVLVILEFSSGEIRELVKGEIHTLSPSGNDLYFQSGARICRIRDWREGFHRTVESETVVEFPPGVADMGVGPDLAVSDDAIYAVLSYKGQGDIIVFKVP